MQGALGFDLEICVGLKTLETNILEDLAIFGGLVYIFEDFAIFGGLDCVALGFR